MAPPFSLSPDIATTLARLTCHLNHLPQGAPSSPVISNMICWKMDRELQQLAAANKATYTRYVDDITFSTSENVFPSALGEIKLNKCIVGQSLESVILANGFSINAGKVRLQYHRSRQEVTGLIVNTKVNVRRGFVSQLRVMLHDW